ncbi:Uncharacterised protein [Comamonas testosteroni]|uniref:Uncharacterized protein n=1 Tax=Comamonas testosteroni TaxID=285 RepID=A0A8B4SCN9_COMTE|nr:Uncharacterised protein [Comamonas testosteroni]
MNFTVPGSLARMPASASAAPMSMATWASCPQACMTETCLPMYWALALEAKDSPVFSATGSASISARRATVLPGWPPRSTPTTPVPPTPVCTSMPRRRR